MIYCVTMDKARRPSKCLRSGGVLYTELLFSTSLDVALDLIFLNSYHFRQI